MNVPAYETIIGDPKHAFEEMGKFFMDKGNINEAVRDLSHRLDEAHTPYALIGALALAQHGMVRATVEFKF